MNGAAKSGAVAVLPYAVGAVILIAVFYALKKSGGLGKLFGQGLLGEEGIGGTLREGLIGEDLEEAEIGTSQVIGPLAGSNTAARPGIPSKPFVIPITGSILKPAQGERIDRRLFDRAYLVSIEISNNSDAPINGRPQIVAAYRYAFGDDEKVTTFGEGRLIPPGTKVKIDVPTKSPLTLQGSYETEAVLQFEGRTLDRKTYRVV